MAIIFLPNEYNAQAKDSRDTTTVEVEGIGFIVGNDKARARDEALRDAYRRAIEKGTGVKIKSETTMELFVVLKDIVQARSEGYVKRWNIKKEGMRDKELYSVTVTAEVVKGHIKKEDIDSLKVVIDLMGNPRFIVFIDEMNLGEKPSYSILENELTKYMIQHGYHTIDPEQKKLVEELEWINKVRMGCNVEIKESSLRMKTEVIIVGNVYTEKLPQHEYFKDTDWVSCKAYSSVRVIIVETGKILDLKNIIQGGTGLTYQDAGVAAIKKCGQTIVDKLVWELPLYLGPSQMKTIQVLVNNLSYSDYKYFTDKLTVMRNVTSVFPREWKKGEPVIYDVKTTGSAEELAARLEALELEVIRLNMNKIEVTVLKKSGR